MFFAFVGTESGGQNGLSGTTFGKHNSLQDGSKRGPRQIMFGVVSAYLSKDFADMAKDNSR